MYEAINISDASERSDRSCSYPLVWNVKLHQVPTFRAAFKVMSESFYNNETSALLEVHKHISEIEDRWDDWIGEHWQIIVEDMCGTFNGDNDVMRWVRPEIAEKYGLKSDHEFVAKFSFIGRQGGWLVLEKFESIELSSYADFDANDIWDANTIIELAAYVEEVGHMVKLRHDEFTYQAAFQMNCQFERAIEDA